MKQINFDMDGTIADFYGVEGWLDDLQSSRVRPYVEAKPLFNMSLFARYLNKLQRNGYTLAVISWTAKDSTPEYHEIVKLAKLNWLHRHLPSVHWDEIIITDYGTPKSTLGSGILFDDNETIREDWGENAYDIDNIIGILKSLI